MLSSKIFTIPGNSLIQHTSVQNLQVLLQHGIKSLSMWVNPLRRRM